MIPALKLSLQRKAVFVDSRNGTPKSPQIHTPTVSRTWDRAVEKRLPEAWTVSVMEGIFRVMSRAVGRAAILRSKVPTTGPDLTGAGHTFGHCLDTAAQTPDGRGPGSLRQWHPPD